MGQTLSMRRAKAFKGRKTYFKSTDSSNDSSEEGEWATARSTLSTFEKSLNDLNLDQNDFYETCGIRISLRGVDLPDTIMINHVPPSECICYQKWRKEGKNFDVKIRIGDTEIPAHKSILRFRIPFFSALLEGNWKESSSGIFTLDPQSYKFDVTMVESLLDYAYTGRLSISTAHVQNLMMAADCWGIESIMDECDEFMRRRIRYEDALPLFNFYKCIGYTKFSELLRFIDTNFIPISLTSDFVDLSIDDLSMILKRNSLNVDDEKQVFESIDRWIGREEGRKEFGPRLFKLVRCPRISSSFRTDVIMKKEWVMDNPECVEVMKEAEEIRLREMQGEKKSIEWSDRFCDDAHRLIFTIGKWSDVMWEQNGENSTETEMMIYDPMSDTWQRSMNKDRYGALEIAEIAVFGEKLYFVGHDVNNPAGCYDTKANEWTPIPSMGGERWFPAVGVIDGRIYASGGCGDEFEDPESLAIFNPLDPNPGWVEFPMTKTVDGACCVLNGLLYVIGLHSAEYYNPDTNTWTSISPMKNGGRDCTAAVLNGEIYVVGGRSPKKVMRYSPGTDSWTEVASLNHGRRDPGVVTSCGRLFVVGGTTMDGESWLSPERNVTPVEMYNPKTNVWTERTPMPHRPDYFHVCALPIPASHPTPPLNF